MPLGQTNIEREEKIYLPRTETPGSVERPAKKLEIIPPPGEEGGTEHNKELGKKIDAAEERAVVTQGESGAEKPTKTIKQLGAELIEIVNNVPQGDDVNMKQVEDKCAEVVNSIIGDGDKSPEKIKEELIAFAEEYFKNYSSIGFIITELFRIAGQKINTSGY